MHYFDNFLLLKQCYFDEKKFGVVPKQPSL